MRQYAADALYESALDFLPDASLETALRVPELARALAPLADADRLARAKNPEALGCYEQWLAEFGVPTLLPFQDRRRLPDLPHENLDRPEIGLVVSDLKRLPLQL